MAELSLNTISGGYDLQKLNSNFQAIQDAINDKLLWRVAEADKNIIAEDLDADGFTIYNLPNPVLSHNAATKCYVDSLVGNANLATCTYGTFTPNFTNKTTNVVESLSTISSNSWGSYTIIGREVFFKVFATITAQFEYEGFRVSELTFDIPYLQEGFVNPVAHIFVGQVTGLSENGDSAAIGSVVHDSNRGLIARFNILDFDTIKLYMQGSYTLPGEDCGGS